MDQDRMTYKTFYQNVLSVLNEEEKISEKKSKKIFHLLLGELRIFLEEEGNLIRRRSHLSSAFGLAFSERGWKTTTTSFSLLRQKLDHTLCQKFQKLFLWIMWWENNDEVFCQKIEDSIFFFVIPITKVLYSI